MPASTVYLPDLVWTGSSFASGVAVEVRGDGRFGAVGEAGSHAGAVPLPGRAMMPGFVSAHSHAFQRGLRGRGERFAAGAGSFWSWREAMYELVDRLDVALVHELSRQAFSEMLAAGITTVGEFHYVHHGSGARDFALDEAVLQAARETGIRIVLLQVHYRTGAIGQPLQGGQRRFDSASLERYWASVDQLAGAMDPATQSLGAVAHSVRAVPRDEIVALREEARRRDLVFHMHVEEQRGEIEACEAHYGLRPMQMLVADKVVDERFTAVHCTHTDASDMDAFLGAGGRVCLCPLTEANLGDGIPDLPGILRHGEQMCFGTDLNARLSALEELRMLEYEQRLLRMQRGVARDAEGLVAPLLLRAGTLVGAAALGIDAGAVRPGDRADFVLVDLDDPSLVGWSQDSLAESLVFGGGDSAIASTWVGGRLVHELAASSHELA